MGEAKDKAKLGVTRRVHVTLPEKHDLVRYFSAEQRGGRPGWVAKDKAERRALVSAMRQLGCLEFWKMASGRALSGEQARFAEVEVCEVTVDAIAFLLGALTASTGSESVGLTELEERLEDARDGRYEVPAEMLERARRAAEEVEEAVADGASSPAEQPRAGGDAE